MDGVAAGDPRMMLIHAALRHTFEGAAVPVGIKQPQRSADEQAIERRPVGLEQSTADQLAALYAHALELRAKGIIP
jgi:hypothetical protein